jgi:regulation of enolase protein 1 (concanavalin A-like superfamily)
MFEQCVWLNEPTDWHLEAGVLNVTTDQKTDFWRETQGIEMSDGKALLSSVLTFGQSDWATAIYGDDPADFRMRATVGHGVL